MLYEEIYDVEYSELDDADFYRSCVVSKTAGIRILEIGIGTGRIAENICQLKGVRYSGIESDLDALKFLKLKKIKGLEIIEGCFPVDFSGRPFVDLIIFPFNGISYLSSDSLDSFFRGAAEALNEDGEFVFDMLLYNRDYVVKSNGKIQKKLIYMNDAKVEVCKNSLLTLNAVSENYIKYSKKFTYLNSNMEELCNKNFNVTVYRLEFLIGMALMHFSSCKILCNANNKDNVFVLLKK